MPTFLQAQNIILESVRPLPAETRSLLETVNMVASEVVPAGWDLPTFDNSAMDGYAVRSGECQPGRQLAVDGTVLAGGRREQPVPSLSAVRIMTGAPLPHECDAVIPFEELLQEEPEMITVPDGVKKGQHIRFRGEDIRLGEAVISPGTVIRAAEVSLLAATGTTAINVFRRVRVAILSTGDELVDAGADISTGGIINSNSPALAAAVSEAGGEPFMVGIARDTRESLREKISAGLGFDVLVTSAGVSAGERDLVREVLLEMGVKPVFWKIGIKPGGPTAFGMKGDVPVFSLPGNPVSTLLTFEEFVRPALLKMMGHQRIYRPVFKGILAEEVHKKRGKASLLRVKVQRDGNLFKLCSAGNQQTGLQRTLLNADAVAMLPADCTAFAAGEEVSFHFLSDSALLGQMGC
jgi:molybdopterin molybdotransferase